MVQKPQWYDIKIALVEILIKQIYLPILIEPIAAIAMVLVFWQRLSQHLLITWLLVLLAIWISRLTIIYVYHHYALVKAKEGDLPYKRWLLLLAITSLLSGITWGSIGYLFMIPNDIFYQAFIIFVLAGATAACNPIYSPHPGIYSLLLFTLTIPLMVWLLVQGQAYVILALLVCAYIAIMLITSLYFYRALSSALILQFANRHLIADLSSSNLSLEKQSQALENSLSLLAATLEATHDGILVVKINDQVENYNQKFLDMWHFTREMIVNSDNKKLFAYALNLLIDPEGFKSMLDQLYQNVDLEFSIEIRFKDGRIFDCYSQPYRVAGQNRVRVWSFRDITARKLMEAKLTYQAKFDSLTGLPNRPFLLDRLTQAISFSKRTKTLLAILFIDIDRFKFINDRYGHAYGDQFLIEVAKRLTLCVRESDTVSRQGGDEFIIIINSIAEEIEIANLVRAILDKMSIPFTIENANFNTSASIGISFYPRDGDHAETLIRNADIAMYRAKELGRNTFQFFTDEINKNLMNRLMMESQLRYGLEHEEFALVYQPIINLENQQIIGLEALIRWHDQTMGDVLPMQFIPIAEESGIIIPLGEWIVKQVCRQLAQWQRQGYHWLNVSINVSGRQFKQVDFADRFINLILQSSVKPSSITIELTESVIMDDINNNIAAIKKLKKAGIAIVIDDFGTGYSSLSYLTKLPVDKLKIDYSFIKELPLNQDCAAVTSAIIALAARLNLKVVAEGVENKQQLDFLKLNHCDEIQGFYFFKPLTVAACDELFANDGSNH
jgi:diguanylate cyclase (GGDEF)-like protein/PAS domain S-box-containing protein